MSGSVALTLHEAERAFLDASIAVWVEIDKHTRHDGTYAENFVPEQLQRDSELRRVEREAWHRYRDILKKLPALQVCKL